MTELVGGPLDGATIDAGDPHIAFGVDLAAVVVMMIDKRYLYRDSIVVHYEFSTTTGKYHYVGHEKLERQTKGTDHDNRDGTS